MSIRMRVESIDVSEIEELLENPSRARMALANQAYADMNNYVPFRDGDLRNQSTITRDASAIEYHAPYAAAQYQGYIEKGGSRITFGDYTTPGTGPKWDEKAASIHMSDWEEVVRREMSR